MAAKHRIPNIFNIYMVDVLCCALGCVILLWLVNFQKAKNQTEAAEDTGKKLALARKSGEELSQSLSLKARELAELNNLLDGLRALLSESQLREAGLKKEISDVVGQRTKLENREKDLNKQVTQITGQREKLESNLETTARELAAVLKNLKLKEVNLAKLQTDFENLRDKNSKTEAELQSKIKAYEKLAGQFTLAEQKIASQEKDLKTRTSQNLADAKTLDDLNNRLKDAEALVKKLEKENLKYESLLVAAADLTKNLKDDVLLSKKRILEVDKTFQELLKDKDALNRRLTEALLLVSRLEKDQVLILKKAEAAEKRFAGIALTGQRVLFLMDMSGSMGMRDAYVEDKTKWPLACDVVGKIMESLPRLEKYQIILFSDKTFYPLGNEGQWLDYNPNISVKMAVDRLKARKPEGGTNMSVVFEEAFRYRDMGLDGIYILSDGLPNSGEGLPTNFSGPEEKKSEYLTKYVRQRLQKTWNPPIAGRRVPINAIGFFFDSPDVGAFLWAMARENEGSFVGMSRP